MESYYQRTEDIDQKIHSVKLPYLAWKVLFLVDEGQTLTDLKGLLNEKETLIQEALDILVAEGLLSKEQAKKEELESENKVEEKTTSEKASEEDVNEMTPEVEEKEEPIAEIIEEEIIEETVIKDEEIEPAAKEEEIEESELFADVESITEEPEKAEEEPKAEEEKLESDFFAEEPPDFVIGKTKEKEAEAKEAEEEGEEDKSEAQESVFDLQEDLEDSSVFEDSEVETVEEAEAEKEEEEIEIPENQEEQETFNLDINFEETLEEAEKQPTTGDETGIPTKDVTEGENIILVIDDSIVIRKMVELALENESYQIETAVTGKDGLKLLDQLQPDLVILDLMLPDINGIDLLKTIKASKGIPVIMLSGKDSPQMIEKARAEGADAFLPKPFRDEELVQTIKNLLKK